MYNQNFWTKVGCLQWLVSRDFRPTKRSGPRLLQNVLCGINVLYVQTERVIYLRPFAVQFEHYFDNSAMHKKPFNEFKLIFSSFHPEYFIRLEMHKVLYISFGFSIEISIVFHTKFIYVRLSVPHDLSKPLKHWIYGSMLFSQCN